MSALDGWIDVCRTGTWTDARGRQVDVTDATLDGLVAAHAAQDPVPVVVGHPALDAPAYGFVEAVRRTGDRLQAKFRDLMPAFREAVEAGRYTARSIAIKEGALRHVGFLGGRPPAVPGLAPTQFGSEADTVIEFAGDTDERLWQIRSGWMAMARTARSWREHLIEDKDLETADKIIPGWEVETIERAAEAAREMETPAFAGSDTTQTENNTMDETELAARQADLDAREARIESREQETARQATLAAADRALAAHVEAGRVLPAERAGLAALLASLPEDDTTLTFAAPEGEVTRKPREILETLLAAQSRVEVNHPIAA